MGGNFEAPKEKTIDLGQDTLIEGNEERNRANYIMLATKVQELSDMRDKAMEMRAESSGLEAEIQRMFEEYDQQQQVLVKAVNARFGLELDLSDDTTEYELINTDNGDALQLLRYKKDPDKPGELVIDAIFEIKPDLTGFAPPKGTIR